MSDSRDRIDAEAEAYGSVLDAALAAESADAFVEGVTATFAQCETIQGAAIYLGDERLPAAAFAGHGVGSPNDARARCEQAWSTALQGNANDVSAEGEDGAFSLNILHVAERVVGVVLLAGANAASDALDALLPRLARIVDQVIERDASTLRVRQLNAYLTISSSLGRALDLSEALEIALYCSMEAVEAEAASVLLLDDEKENLLFYSVEGAAQPVLKGSSFPADRGISGAVLASLEAVTVNDVQGDERFYERIDSESGFETRNLIAVPLVAGEERVGVLEVLNKADGSAFVEDERLLLVAIADQIAFAIRNARIFECLVDSYCNRRRGIYSCKGCERPLGSWTPCMRYHDPNL
jgi:hypothetical protein